MQRILLLFLMSFSLGVQANSSNYLLTLQQEKIVVLEKNQKLKTKKAELIKLRDKLKKHVKGFGIATAALTGTTITTFIAGASAKNKGSIPHYVCF